MLLNDDFGARTLVDATKLQWVPSTSKDVERRMLFRIGGEKARATSIVRYAPGSRFSRHTHPGGEEFLVLEGTFQDETGDFPAGTYVRNPPGTGHAPGSTSGCTIFVRLWQFRKDDRERVVRLPGEGEPASLRVGVSSSLILFEGKNERVVLEEWEPNAVIELQNAQGIELFVVAGAFVEAGQALEMWSWLRLPAGQSFRAQVGPRGARVWCRFAPLLHDDACAFDDQLGDVTER
jgi:quercetin dioxygenase-like cupin family protein